MTQTRHWGPSAPGGRGRGVKHILGKYQARGRRQETSPGIGLGFLRRYSLTSYHLHQKEFLISWLPLLPLQPAHPATHFSSTKCHAACVCKTSCPLPAALRRALPATRPPAPPPPQAAPFPPRPRPAPAARARAARTAPGAALDKHLSRLGSARFGGESIGNSGRVLARFRKFPTARVVSELSSGRRWEGGVA